MKIVEKVLLGEKLLAPPTGLIPQQKD